ncbi:MAG: hypothetical protein ACNA7U_06625 [Candidatus Izemoplasmataceae bacterium]
MKKLLFSLLFILFTLIGIPVLLVGLMYNGNALDEMPLSLYTENADAQQELYTELNQAITSAKTGMDTDLELKIHQDIINIAIFNAIRGDDDTPGPNPNYLPNEDCDNSECLYIFEENINGDLFIRVVGVWITFEEDTLIANIALEVDGNQGFTFKSIIRTELLLTDDVQNQSYTLEFSRLRVGRLPFPKRLFTGIIGLLNNVTDINVDEQLPIGDFDLSELKYTIDKNDIVEYVRSSGEDDATMLLATEVLKIIFDNGLIQFKLNDESFDFLFRLSLIRNSPSTDIPAYLQGFDYEGYEFEQSLRNRFDEFVFTMALTNQTYFTISERSFNRMIYKQMEGFENARFEFEYEDELGNPQTITVGLEAVWFEFRVEEVNSEEIIYLQIKGLFNIDGIKSLLLIRADEVIGFDEDVYAFDLSEITIGKESGKEFLNVTNLQPFKDYLSTMEDFYFGYFSEEGYIIIDTVRLTDLMAEGTQSGVVEVNKVEIVDRALRIHVVATDPSLQNILDSFSGAIYDVFSDPNLNTELESVLDTTNPGPEQDTYNQILTIQAKIDNNEEITDEDVSALFENFDEMSPEAQQAFLETFNGLIDPSLLEEYNNNFE